MVSLPLKAAQEPLCKQHPWQVLLRAAWASSCYHCLIYI